MPNKCAFDLGLTSGFLYSILHWGSASAYIPEKQLRLKLNHPLFAGYYAYYSYCCVIILYLGYKFGFGIYIYMRWFWVGLLATGNEL